MEELNGPETDILANLGLGQELIQSLLSGWTINT